MKFYKKVLHKKVSGATLIETIMATIILVAIFSIAIVIYLNVVRSSTSSLVMRAKIETNSYAESIKRDKTFIIPSNQFYKIDKTIKRKNTYLQEVKLSATHNNELLYSTVFYLYSNEEE